MKKVGLSFTSVLILSTLYSNAIFAKSTSNILAQKISNDLTIFKGKEYGTNIGGIKTSNGVVLIDPMPGKSNLAELHEAISKMYHEQQTFLINTHDHEDHTGGNEYFLAMGSKNFRGSLDIFGIEKVKVASHSSVDHIYYHKTSNSIFVGDVFDSSWHPTFYFGGLKGLDNAIDSILALGDESSLIVPGHGKPANKSALHKFRSNTFEWVARVKVLTLKGFSLEEIIKDKEANEILQKFNGENSSSFLPEKAHKRFIQRTLSLISKN